MRTLSSAPLVSGLDIILTDKHTLAHSLTHCVCVVVVVVVVVVWCRVRGGGRV